MIDFKKYVTKYRKYILPALFLLAALIVLFASKGENAEEPTREIASSLLSEELEEKLEDLCRSVDGVRYAKVLLTLDTSTEYVLAKDVEKNGNYVKVETVKGDGEGIELYVVSPKVRGVAVVCTGGDRATVKKTVIDLVGAALGIDSSRISVAGSQ